VGNPSREDMLELGRATGRASTREQSEEIIHGLMGTVKMVQEESGGDSEIAWSLMSAIEGIRETMKRDDEASS
jgi:hypothetical protein